jgi:hypothetical protein
MDSIIFKNDKGKTLVDFINQYIREESRKFHNEVKLISKGNF